MARISARAAAARATTEPANAERNSLASSQGSDVPEEVAAARAAANVAGVSMGQCSEANLVLVGTVHPPRGIGDYLKLTSARLVLIL